MFKEKELPKAVSTYYKKIVPLAYNQGFLGLFGLIKKISTFFIGLKRSIPREPTSFNDMKIWAHKSTALACQTLMLSLRAFGYDSCPMEGIDSRKIKKLLKLPKNLVLLAQRLYSLRAPKYRHGYDGTVHQIVDEIDRPYT